MEVATAPVSGTVAFPVHFAPVALGRLAVSGMAAAVARIVATAAEQSCYEKQALVLEKSVVSSLRAMEFEAAVVDSMMQR